MPRWPRRSSRRSARRSASRAGCHRRQKQPKATERRSFLRALRMAWASLTVKSETSLRVRAMRFLARREHSRTELKRKLVPIAIEGEDIEALLDDLCMRGWLSDARYAEQSIRAKRSEERRVGKECRSGWWSAD